MIQDTTANVITMQINLNFWSIEQEMTPFSVASANLPVDQLATSAFQLRDDHLAYSILLASLFDLFWSADLTFCLICFRAQLAIANCVQQMLS